MKCQNVFLMVTLLSALNDSVYGSVVQHQGSVIQFPENGFVLRLKAIADQSFKTRFDVASEYIIKRILEATQRFFYLPSLTTKVRLELVGFVEIPDSITATSHNLNNLSHFAADHYSNAFVFFADTEDGDDVNGIAYNGGICPSNSPNRIAIVEWHDSVSSNAGMLAHTIGHLLGMDHDYISRKKTQYRRLDSLRRSCSSIGGIMDGDSNRTIWSPCSVEDFYKYFVKETTRSPNEEFCLTKNRDPVQGVYSAFDSEATRNFITMDYIGSGYHIVEGNPDSIGIDKGFRSQLIDISYNEGKQTNDKKFFTPDGIQIKRGVECVHNETIATISNISDYINQISVAVDVEMDFWKFSLFSLSFKFKHLVEKLTSSKSTLFMSIAFCEPYVLELETFTLKDSFINFVNDLPEELNDDDLYDLKDFVQKYGTHYATQLKMGAKFVRTQLIESTEISSSTLTEAEIKLAVHLNFCKLTQCTVNIDPSYADKLKNAFSRIETKTEEYFFGVPLRGDWDDWTRQNEKEFFPTGYRLAEISTLLAPRYIPSIDAGALKRKRKTLEAYLRRYVGQTLKTQEQSLSSSQFSATVYSKVLVALGNWGSTDIEIVDLLSSETICQKPKNYPFENYVASGILGFNEKPLICGGRGDRSACHVYINGAWNQTDSLKQGRSAFAMTKSTFPDGRNKLFLTGGEGESGSTSEVLTEIGWQVSIALPVRMYDHCMVTVNTTSVMVIGGVQNNDISGKCFLFNSKTNVWTEGPTLSKTRARHSCGLIRNNMQTQGKSLVAVGGYDRFYSSHLSSVEVLDLDSNAWRRGPDLPLAISFATLVEDPSGGVVLIGGIGSGRGNLDTLYKLPHAGPDAAWELMPQKLKKARSDHTAFLIPDEIAACHQENWTSSGFGILIAGGFNSEPLPYQVGIWNRITSQLFCGGTLISQNYVLTAAHCTSDIAASNVVVAVGDLDLEIRDGEIFIDVERIIDHPNYNIMSWLDNDFSILKLASPAPISHRVFPACLPADSFQTFSGTELIISGWGASYFNGPITRLLQAGYVRGISNRACSENYPNTTITANMICADAIRGNVCQGDSGGPLVAIINGRVTLVGVTSFGRDCTITPGVFARVTAQKDWILANAAGACLN